MPERQQMDQLVNELQTLRDLAAATDNVRTDAAVQGQLRVIGEIMEHIPVEPGQAYEIQSTIVDLRAAIVRVSLTDGAADAIDAAIAQAHKLRDMLPA